MKLKGYERMWLWTFGEVISQRSKYLDWKKAQKPSITVTNADISKGQL
jgi:hypothetical protein